MEGNTQGERQNINLIKNSIMDTATILQKVQADFTEMFASIQTDPVGSAPMITTVVAALTEFGYFEQAETGESNSIKFIINKLIEVQDQIKADAVKVAVVARLEETIRSAKEDLDDIHLTGVVPEELSAQLNAE